MDLNDLGHDADNPYGGCGAPEGQIFGLFCVFACPVGLTILYYLVGC